MIWSIASHYFPIFSLSVLHWSHMLNLAHPSFPPLLSVKRGPIVTPLPAICRLAIWSGKLCAGGGACSLSWLRYAGAVLKRNIFFFCGSKQHVLLHCKNNRQWHEPSRPWPLRSDDWIIETLWTTWSHVTWKPFGNHFIISSFQFMSIHFKWLQWFPFSFPTQSSFSWSLSTLPPCHLRVPGPGGDLLGRTGSARSPCLEGSPGTGGTHPELIRNGQGTLPEIRQSQRSKCVNFCTKIIQNSSMKEWWYLGNLGNMMVMKRPSWQKTGHPNCHVTWLAMDTSREISRFGVVPLEPHIRENGSAPKITVRNATLGSKISKCDFHLFFTSPYGDMEII